ncbi:hypothetical protein STG2_123 [Salmonella phage STG2]|uniref:Lipoprotein n=1 Tax=Salmonella phage STG2 TaxID=2480623 RepID=A0A3G2KAV0_9CAUD|nr:Rz-like spanin [Salmonella phage STG2]AYN56087.1 hypothetical protein STG2_123 [Salmonella phage STG2]
MKRLLLLSVLILAGCDPYYNSIRFTAEDTRHLCDVAGGELDNSSIQIGLTKGIFYDSYTITSTCVRNK